jgi:glyoxylase-like metal-dependent hydrolase (beta-lactamase superfamily II)
VCGTAARQAIASETGILQGVVIVERTENPVWLSNAYLVADEAGGKGVLIDGNDELGPLLERAERDGIEITHVLVTHPHPDHVAGLAGARESLGNPPLVAHAEAAAQLDQEVATVLADGEKLSTGGLEIEAILTPGHAAGHLACSSTAPTSSPPTSSSRARWAARWRRAPAASPTSRPR